MAVDESVELYVFGLRTILSEPITARADLESTWYDFLNNVCGIRVGPEDQVMACTTSFSVPAKRGWSADLSEKIRIFVEKFSIKKDKYSVRIMMKLPHHPGGTQSVVQQQQERQSTSHSNINTGHRQITVGSGSGRRSFVAVCEPLTQSANRRTTSSTNHRNAYSIGSQVYRRGTEVVVEDVEDDDYLIQSSLEESLELEIDEAAPVEMEAQETPVTNSTTQPNVMRNERRKSKNRRDELKPLVKDRFKRFNNAFLLRVENEIKILQGNQLWDRNVQHSPLGSYLLQELFTE